jgi:hypothetical protein
MRKVSWLLMVVMATVLLASVGMASSHGAKALRDRASTRVRALTRFRGEPGRLVGAIVFSGRVPQGAAKNRYQRGWVVVSQHEHRVAKQWVKVNHKYHFALAPGTYDIAGHDRWGNCRDTAQIRAGHTIDQNVYCTWH